MFKNIYIICPILFIKKVLMFLVSKLYKPIYIYIYYLDKFFVTLKMISEREFHYLHKN